MNYLLDVNVLLALAHQSHAEHRKVSVWFQSVSPIAQAFHTCAITELGFVRASVQAGLEADLAAARQTLASLVLSSRIPFTLLSDGLGVSVLPKYVKTQSQSTDGHLLELATSAGAKFVTLDKGIPGALLIR